MSVSLPSVWGNVLGRILMPTGDRIFGQRMMQRLRFLRGAQWWPQEHIEAERDRALRATIETAYREVPLYRDLMDAAGVAPPDIRGAADLPKMPIVTKDLLREGYPDRAVRPTRGRVIENRTSGSTGTNLIVLADPETVGWYRAAFLLIAEWTGWSLGDPHVQTGMTLDRSIDRRLKDLMLRCHYVSAFDLSDDHLDRVLSEIERRRIRHVWGYPGSLYHLARRAEELRWNQPLQGLLTWGDMLLPQYRSTIERVFEAPVHDAYGCAEGIQVAAQCGQGDHYHVLALDTVAEFVDEDGDRVPDGCPGEVVLTRLHPGPMPLIRYKVGDIARGGPADQCPCGRGFQLMSSIQGRDTDIVLTPSGNRLIVHFFTGTLEHFSEIKSFQVIQPALDSMILRLVPGPGFTREVAEHVVCSLREHGAESMRIDVDVVPEIPLERTGKRRIVISQLDTAKDH